MSDIGQMTLASAWTLDGYMNMVDGCGAGCTRDRYPVIMPDGSQRAACIECIQDPAWTDVMAVIAGTRPLPLLAEPLMELELSLASILPEWHRDLLLTEVARRYRAKRPS